jgi:3-deoxy-manno-octulosonate cytidylyltransferase (CMP-KDO synthetase)
MKAVGVIPARFASSRFPGKPLAKIFDKPMIQWVYERASQSKALSEVIIATDHSTIIKACEKFRAKALMTSASHLTGTERVAEVAEGLNAEIIVNIQGDEPLIRPESIDKVISPFYEDDRVQISTLKYAIEGKQELEDPNVVKVIVDKDDYAIYFSRLPIPYQRNAVDNFIHYKHIGIYAYKRDILLKLAKLKPSPLEKIEALEQLRFLENGYRIKVIETNYNSFGIDTPEDLKRILKMLNSKTEAN